MVKIVKCIENSKLYLRVNNITYGKKYKVLKEDAGFYRLRDDRGVLSWLLMERFEEVKEPTIQDLLAKAKELYDKGLLKYYGEDSLFSGEKTVFARSSEKTCFKTWKEEDVEEGLKYLQSLEVETFKIETVEDFKRIKGNAKIELVNGTVLRVNSIRPFTRVGARVTVSIENPKEWGEQFDAHLPYSYLKGATVTQ